MKRVRGFGYVGDDVDREDEFESDEVNLEHGFASEHVTLGVADFKPYTCPRCERLLFYADVSLHGVILIRCKRCRREVSVITEPIMQRIGYIQELHKEEEE